MHKFPRMINKKRTRYSKIEKIFILYLIVLCVLEVFLPFIKIDGVDFAFVNTKFLLSSIITLASLVFIVFWNASYSVKGFIKEIFGFEYNEALINFGVLFLHASLLIYAKGFISVIAESQSATFYQLLYGYYILGVFIVLGLIWNLFLAFNLSLFNKRKANYSKVVSNNFQDENIDDGQVKSLFDKDNI